MPGAGRGAGPGAGRGGAGAARSLARWSERAGGSGMGLCLPCLGGAAEDVVETPDPVSAGQGPGLGPRLSPLFIISCPLPSPPMSGDPARLIRPGGTPPRPLPQRRGPPARLTSVWGSWRSFRAGKLKAVTQHVALQGRLRGRGLVSARLREAGTW